MKWSNILFFLLLLGYDGHKRMSSLSIEVSKKSNDLVAAILHARDRSEMRFFCRLRGGDESGTFLRRRPDGQETLLSSTADKEEISENIGGEVENDEPPRDKVKREPRQRKLDKLFEKKLQAYSKKYGVSIGPPANPLPMLLEKAAKSMDAKTKFKIRMERFELQKKEIDSIKKQLKDDDSRRPCRSSFIHPFLLNPLQTASWQWQANGTRRA